jgi:hypothetical protein
MFMLPRSWLTPCALALELPGLCKEEFMNKKFHKTRLVLGCVVLLTELVRLALVLLNMANNYRRARTSTLAK